MVGCVFGGWFDRVDRLFLGSRLSGVYEVENTKIKLSFVQRVKLRIFGKVYIGKRKKEGWSDYLPFYVFRCPTHNLVEDYPHGLYDLLKCPRCFKNEL